MVNFFPSSASPERTARRLFGEGGLERYEQKQAQKRRTADERSRSAVGLARRPDLRHLLNTRRTTSGDLAPRGAATGLPSPPSLGHIVLSRLQFSRRPGDIGAFWALGATPDARLAVWLEQQLDPTSINDSECDSRISAAGYQTLHKTFDQIWQQHYLPEDIEWEDYIRPFTETELSTWLRAVYSKRQLQEVMTRFWHDHFSIFGEDIGPVFMTYDRDVIRPNIFGNFRTLLEAVAAHPAMLEYLDNKYNSFEPDLENDGLNENFGRELLELHTLGAEHFMGNVDPGSVPVDENGFVVGYTDADVTMTARCLTGWTISDQPWDPDVGNTGHFLYIHDWHDTVNDKRVLGQWITDKHTPLRDGRDLFDILAGHPATARFIATKLCRRLVADEPPESLIAAAAQTFHDHVDSPDQIARVLRTIILSDTFKNTWAEKVKRPFEIVTGAMRGGNIDLRFANDYDGGGLLWNLYLTGNIPFGWSPPNGYPDFKGAWISSAPRVMSWGFTNWLPFIFRGDEWWEDPAMDLLGQTPNDLVTANQIVDFWVNRILGGEMPSHERQQLVDFLRWDRGPDAALDFDYPWEAPDRLRMMVGMIFMSPSFLWL